MPLLHFSVIIDTNSSVRKHLKSTFIQVLDISFVVHDRYKLYHEQTSDPHPYLDAGCLKTTAAHWNGHVLGTELKHRLCFQPSVLTLLAFKPPILGIWEPQCSLLPAHQKEEVP